MLLVSIKAMDLKVDIVGFSMGAFIAQEILLQEPQLIRKRSYTELVLLGRGIKNVSKITYLIC
jgi:pimeloyl-ACP methyl ester carboxylesterase